MATKLKLMGKGHSDELYTPECALDVLLRFIPKEKVLFECAVGTGQLKSLLENKGYKVVSSNDFFNENPEHDIIVTNPPYKIKDAWLKECYKRGKPFALLLPLTALEGMKRQALYQKYGIQIVFPKKRIDFNGKGNVWFYTAWFCWKLNLPKTLNFAQEDV